MRSRNQELAQQLRTPNLREISHLQTELLDLRNSVARNQSSENRDADDLRNVRGKILP